MLFEYFEIAFLLVLAAVLVAILPYVMTGGPDNVVPRTSNGKKPFRFSLGALLLLGMAGYYIAVIAAKAGARTALAMSDVLQTAVLAEHLVEIFIALLILCGNYGGLLRYNLLMKISLLVFNSLVAQNDTLRQFLVTFPSSIANIGEILVWVGLFRMVKLVRDGSSADFEEHRKWLILYRVLPLFLLLKLLLPATLASPLSIGLLLAQVACYYLLLMWFYSPYRKHTEAWEKRRERAVLTKKCSGAELKFVAIALAVVLAVSAVWGAIAQIRLPHSGIDDATCASCQGSGLVPKGEGFGYQTCPTCKGTGIPPL